MDSKIQEQKNKKYVKIAGEVKDFLSDKILPTLPTVFRLNHHEIISLSFSKDLVDTAYKLLIQEGFAVNLPTEENVTLEYHVYTSDSKDSNIQSYFDEVHCDDYGATDYPVHTIIFYLENTFPSGGNLIIYTEQCEETIDPRKTSILLLSGDIFHKVTNCVGIGTRRSIVAQFRAKNSNESDHVNEDLAGVCLFDNVALLKKSHENGIDITQGNNYVLRHASLNGSFHIVNYILLHVQDIPQNTKNIAIQWATENGHYDIGMLLLQNGADFKNASEDFQLSKKEYY